MPQSLTVVHHAALRKFSAMIDGEEAYLLYHSAGEGVLDYVSTFVPEPLRGQGIASAVVCCALEYARQQRCRVIPTCWFVKGYVDEHPEYLDLVAN